jgi:hypothetical protein
MPPVATEKLLMFVEEGETQPVYDPLTILLPDPEYPEGFQSLLFSDRPLTYDQWDDFYLPSSICRQGPKTR